MDLIPGDQLLDDTFNHSGVLVLPKDSKLSNESITRLLQHNIDYIDIREREFDLGHTDDKSPSNTTHKKINEQFHHAIHQFEHLFLSVLAKGTYEDNKMEQLLQSVVATLEEQKDVVSLLLLLHGQQTDDYRYNHSLQVGMLAYYIAKWLQYSDAEAYLVSKAGFLIDIGSSKLPLSIINKPERLTEQEFAEIKKHPEYSYDIIMESTKDELSALVALQHHEREDGSGYPKGLRNEDIHPYAKIIAVADVYTAMISNRVYQTKQELLTVLKELNSLSFNLLSPEPTQVLISHLLPNFIGKRVLLSTGKSGIIVMTNPTDFFRPLVQIDTDFIDLARQPDIIIQEVFL
jgi:HD-GYP domain-containing protein (c-di-GMP phosphodiesterase class II)